MTTAAISSRSLSKQYRNYEQPPGVFASLKTLFHRRYRTVSAVSDFSFEIPAGEIVGLLGPNGAGKTTLMKMMTGIIEPSGGAVSVLGHTPFARSRDFRRRIALVMGQKSQLWWDIPALESFKLLQRYYEVSDEDFRKRLDQLTEILDVGRLLHVHVRKLSLGERMKMELIACLLHAPEILFLDEPTIGLDVVAQTAIREFLKRYQREKKTTIVLTSHYMADVQALCSRIVLILDGKKRFDGPLSRFETFIGSEKAVTLSFSDAVRRDDPILSPFHPEWSDDGARVALRLPEQELRVALQTLLHHLPVSDISTEKLPIERVMERLLTTPQLLEESE